MRCALYFSPYTPSRPESCTASNVCHALTWSHVAPPTRASRQRTTRGGGRQVRQALRRSHGAPAPAPAPPRALAPTTARSRDVARGAHGTDSRVGWGGRGGGGGEPIGMVCVSGISWAAANREVSGINSGNSPLTTFWQ